MRIEPAYICTESNSPGTDYSIKTLSFDKKAKLSTGGFRILPDYSIDDFPPDFALLLLTEGAAWAENKNNDYGKMLFPTCISSTAQAFILADSRCL